MRGSNLASNIKFLSDYARYIDDENRIESWEDSVFRIMNMHRKKYAHIIAKNPKLAEAIDFAENFYLDKRILGSQRALQFGGAPMLKHEAKMYNCIGGYIDRVKAFPEVMYWLLCGCGVGFSVQQHHIDHLPPFVNPPNKYKHFVVLDSIEGWSDAVGALMSSYIHPSYKHLAPAPHYVGKRPIFDYSPIRDKGAYISGGFKAPGPEGLKTSIEAVRKLLDEATANGTVWLTPIQVYDIIMHFAEAVLSGGVRRSATICLFDYWDEEMLNAKTGNWMEKNPQRARSNNSAILVRNTTTKAQFEKIFESIREFGEPGFVFVDDRDIVVNPCVEIGFWPQTEEGESGWQGCNLTEINGGMCETEEDFYETCRAAAIIGTLQAGYTNFKYVSNTTRRIFEREALLGVSVTGWADNPNILFNTDVQREGAEVVKATNRIIAQYLGINAAARTTCVKPSGNASVLLGTASGIHGEHAAKYFRIMQMNKDNDVAKAFAKHNPDAVEEGVWSNGKTDWAFYIPIEAPADALFKRHLVGINQLELVRITQNNWVEHGTNPHLAVNPKVRNNVSNTIQVDDWDMVCDYIFEHKEDFAGISLLHIEGDKEYAQAPFTEVFDRETLIKWYGDAALFASGLIVDGLHAFDDDLWRGLRFVLNKNKELETITLTELQLDWLRRAHKFAHNYFEDDLGAMSHCLKDIYNYHKWVKINSNLVDIDWSKENITPKYVDVSTLAAVACAGGECEIEWNR